VINDGYQILYYTFSVILDSIPKVSLSEPEHRDYKWVTPVDTLKMELVHDLDECNKLFYNL